MNKHLISSVSLSNCIMNANQPSQSTGLFKFVATPDDAEEERVSTRQHGCCD